MTYSKAYYAEYYRTNRDRIIARVAAYNKANPDAKRKRDVARKRVQIDSNRAKITALKLTLSCVDCHWRPTTEAETRRLEFDHIDPATKWKAGRGRSTGTGRGLGSSRSWRCVSRAASRAT